ncbi:hypothetical protein DFQ28_005827 [Apophysomyces sp. BC1034]|nr:hypothetical protein DFQ30_005917 [Apophysomyces sp. BC1015]KAG0177402.1 hypothetical protein DFQ29_004894 [Apophysomyces sp. BC1021]KAG0187793.1 hypothetical protein DFQ28_005827 [Apophysomyces sp. BC1034]
MHHICVRDDFRLSVDDCKASRVPLLFSTLKVDDWVDSSLLPKELLKQEGIRDKKAAEVKSLMIKLINTIADKRNDYDSLYSCYSSLSKFYKTKNFASRFADTFTLEKKKLWPCMKACSTTSSSPVLVPCNMTSSSMRQLSIWSTRLAAATTKENAKENDPPCVDQQDDNTPKQPSNPITFYMALKEANDIAFQDSTLGTKTMHKALNIFKSWLWRLYHEEPKLLDEMQSVVLSWPRVVS